MLQGLYPLNRNTDKGYDKKVLTELEYVVLVVSVGIVPIEKQ